MTSREELGHNNQNISSGSELLFANLSSISSDFSSIYVPINIFMSTWHLEWIQEHLLWLKPKVNYNLYVFLFSTLCLIALCSFCLIRWKCITSKAGLKKKSPYIILFQKIPDFHLNQLRLSLSFRVEQDKHLVLTAAELIPNRCRSFVIFLKYWPLFLEETRSLH